jgi:hypothetical protein
VRNSGAGASRERSARFHKQETRKIVGEHLTF